MSASRRLFIMAVALSLLGGILVLSVLFDSYKQSIRNQRIADQKGHVRNLATLAAGTAQPDDIAHALGKSGTPGALLIVEDGAGLLHSPGTIEGVEASALTHRLALSLRQGKQQGHFEVEGVAVLWSRAAVPGTSLHLVLAEQDATDLLRGFGRDFGVPVFVTLLVIGWIVVWAALVLNSLFRQLNEQNSLLASQSRKLEEARDKALEANRAKSVFLANMSHEIRTPLTAIIGFSESLLGSSQSMQERISAINTINSSGRHLLHVIDEILDLSKIESGKLDVEPLKVSPVKLLQEICPLMRMQAEGRGLEFGVRYHYPIPELVTTDPTRLKQILFNLVSNAIKFTEHGHVRIEVRCDENREKLIFEVVDTGIGMTPEQQDRLFTAFSQADTSTTRKYGGTGLGLTLSRTFANILGGSLGMESHAGRGSRLRLAISTGPLGDTPFYRHDGQLPAPAEPQETAMANIRLKGEILLAEDNPANQELFDLYIRKLGARATIVDNGAQAVDKALIRQFDLILMDMQMPVMSGVEAVQELRRNGYRGPIVALTANSTIEDRNACLWAGCNDFLSKPVDRKRFVDLLGNYLPVAAPEQEIAAPVHSTLLEDEPEVADLLVQFIEKLPAMIDEVNQAAVQGDRDALKARVHRLKGVGGGYGYPALTAIAGKLEFQIENENRSEIEALLRELATYAERIVAGKSSLKTASRRNATDTRADTG